MMKSLLSRGTVLAGLAVLAACASTPEAETTDTAETVVPTPSRTVPVETGPAPGSYADLQENAGHRVFFGYDQYNLSPEAQATLRRQAQWLNEYPGTSIRIEGNADERGTREYNLGLGARRANAAKSYLVGLGVSASRIQTLSNGKERPVDPRSTPDAWAINRNATSVLVGMAGS